MTYTTIGDYEPKEITIDAMKPVTDYDLLATLKIKHKDVTVDAMNPIAGCDNIRQTWFLHRFDFAFDN